MPDPVTPESPANIFADEPQTPAPTPTPEPPTPAAPPVPPPPTPEPTATLSAADVARIAAEAAAGAAPQPPAGPPPPQLTEAEIMAQLGWVPPTEEHLTKIYAGGKDAVDTLLALLTGTAKYAKLSSAYYAQDLIEQMRQEFAPALQQSLVSQAETHQKNFMKDYPELSDPKYMSTLSQVHKTLQSTGATNGKTHKEVYKMVADGAKQILSSLGITPSAPAPGTPQPNGGAPAAPAASSTSTMTPLPSGGGAGGAPTPGTAAGDPQRATRMSLFA